MNKKVLANLRKEFKDGSYMLPIKEIHTVYLKKDNGEIITQDSRVLGRMDVDTRELYLSNFKKILTGTIDSKIYELNFRDGLYGTIQDILQKTLNEQVSMTDFIDGIVTKIANNFNYDTDIVINFIRAEYHYANKNIDDQVNEYVQSMEFILCTVNKVEVPKRVLKFDYAEMEFKTNSSLDVTVNLNSPLDGFMYPSFDNEGYVDMDKIIYYSHKAKGLNNMFVNDVLGCEIKLTAVEEKNYFNWILKSITKNNIEPRVLQNVYEDIIEKIDRDSGEVKLGIENIKEIFEDNGIDTKLLQNAFEEIGGTNYRFRAENIVPDFRSKSIELQNDNLNIKITPRCLHMINQIKDEKGRKNLNIVLSEDVLIYGMGIQTQY